MTTTDPYVLLQERRYAEARARALASREAERRARQEFVTRSGISYDALVTTYRTLRELSKVDIQDLVKPPGFNLLADGEVGSVNTDTPEWQFWSMLSKHKEDADHLFYLLLSAVDELKVAGHWDEAGAR
jgi:hypothetical protein